MFGKTKKREIIPVPSHVISSKDDEGWPMDAEALCNFGSNPKIRENDFCLSHAFTGVQIFGSTGSGKTSASIKTLVKSYLRTGMGGLVLTAKTDELEEWIKLTEEAGRLDDLISFSPKNDYRFNFMRYEMQRADGAAGQTENLVNLFCNVVEVAERKSGGGGNDAYWQRTLKQLLRNAIDLAIIAADDVDLAIIHKIVSSAPKSLEQLSDEKYQNSSICMLLLSAAEAKEKTEKQKADFELVNAYWTEEFPSFASETRSSIVSIFTSMADGFLRGTMRELFCTDLNLSPEDCFDGKIIVVNLPVKEWNELGQFAQVLFKFVWQRAVERRIPQGLSRKEREQKIRPLFLCADESHFFANSYDAQFQSTARSSRCCTIYATQNMPSYTSVFSNSEAAAFVGNLQTKIFHANGDPTTNKWAADSISQTLRTRYSSGMTQGLSEQKGGGMNMNANISSRMEYAVPPYDFTVLRTGGSEYEFTVDAIIFQAGRSWLNEDGEVQNFTRHSFDQRT